jgi:hypothetical protein
MTGHCDEQTPKYYPEIFGIATGPECGPFPVEPKPFWDKIICAAENRSFHTLLPHAPPILFEDHAIDSVPPVVEGRGGWSPEVLGRYYPGDCRDTGCRLDLRDGRRIEVYPEMVRACCADFERMAPNRRLAWDESDLTLVVVIHELMHALLHTGCPGTQRDAESTPTTPNVQAFLERRLGDFRRIAGPGVPSPVLELHAQLGSWLLLRTRELEPARGPVRAFLDLMMQSPEEYKVPGTLLTTPSEALWSWMGYVRSGRDSQGFGTRQGMESYLLNGLSDGAYPETMAWIYTQLF